MASKFAVALASMLHSSNFIGAAEHIEKSLLDAGVELLESKLPEPVKAIAAPAVEAVEDVAIDETDAALNGRPADTSGMEDRIAAAIVAGLAPLLSKLTSAVASK